MIRQDASSTRGLTTQQLETELVVVGGGLAGVCCAVTAAREGVRVVLIQDRPVLGGNASSEVRLWVLGATSHMGNNNRWAREGGVVDEILLENTYRNPEGNPVIFDTVVLEKVLQEPNITLLLNTAVFELTQSDPDTIASVRAFCSQNSTMYQVNAPLFCDASGDGVVGFMAGAAFRIGAEGRDEFDERLAPEKPTNQLLGHSLYFYTKDVGRPVRYTPPSYALDDITRIPRWRSFSAKEHGCQLWWIEFGGEMDTVHDAERIKWELWKIVYGVWNHIKNSGQFPEAENLTLEWVGAIPGKRESRRFEGDHMLSQRDIVEQRHHEDAVSYGGWAIDLHPSDGVYSEHAPCTQWHSRGVYQIPYRCLYSRNISNLFLAGRIISASHIAFGSTRVMGTCGHNAQAVGVAAAMCTERGYLPRDLLARDEMSELQRRLIRAGQHIPSLPPTPDPDDIAPAASVTSSSTLRLQRFARSKRTLRLNEPCAMLVPVQAGRVPSFTIWAESDAATTLTAELLGCSRHGGFTPDETISHRRVELKAPGDRVIERATVKQQRELRASGKGGASTRQRVQKDSDYIGVAPQAIELDFQAEITRDRYLMICFAANPDVELVLSDERVTGVLALSQRSNRAVSKSAIQSPPPGAGIDTMPFWLPTRRAEGHNLAMKIDPPITCFGAEQLSVGPNRPEQTPNAWVAARDDHSPWVTWEWKDTQKIRRICITFDTDYDHPLESVLIQHPERVMPFCVRNARLKDAAGLVLAELTDNHQSRWDIVFDQPVLTDKLRLEVEQPGHGYPAALFRVMVMKDRDADNSGRSILAAHSVRRSKPGTAG